MKCRKINPSLLSSISSLQPHSEIHRTGERFWLSGLFNGNLRWWSIVGVVEAIRNREKYRNAQQPYSSRIMIAVPWWLIDTLPDRHQKSSQTEETKRSQKSKEPECVFSMIQGHVTLCLYLYLGLGSSCHVGQCITIDRVMLWLDLKNYYRAE